MGKLGNYKRKVGVVVIISCCLIFQLYSKDATIDSLKQILTTTISDSIRYETCKKIGDASYKFSLDSAELYYKKAIVIAQRQKNIRGHISTLRSLGYIHSNHSSNYTKAEAYFQEAHTITQKDQDTIAQTYLLNDLGVLNWKKGLNIQAADYYFRAYQLAQLLKHPQLIMKTSISLGTLYNEEKDNEKAISFYHVALSIADSLNRDRAKGLLFNNMGKAYRDMEKNDSATIYFNKSLEIFKRLEDNDWMSLVYYNIAKNLQETEHLEKAIVLYHKALALNKIIDNKSREAMILTGLAKTHLSRKQYKDAIHSAQKGLAIVKNIDTKLYRKDLHKILAESYQQEGKFQLSNQEFQAYLIAKDSLQEEEKSKIIAQYTHLYESEKKKVEIAELKVENASKQIRLDHSKNIIMLLGGGILLLLTFLNYWHNYQKSKSLEQYKQLRVQLTHDLHDNINSSLNHIKIIANRLSRGDYSLDEKQNYLNRIRNVSNELVDNMHDLIWTLDDKKTNLEDLLDKMEEHASNIFSSLKTPYFLDNSITVSTKNLPTDTKNNIYSIYKEAINNLIKHTHPTNVEIYFSLINNQLKMLIKNDLNNRKEAISSSKIGLKSIQQRAVAINGKVTIEENESTFIITLEVPI